MPVVRCPYPDCDFDTGDVSEAIAVVSLHIHAMIHQGGNALFRGPKLECPRIDMGVETETWNSFVRRWEAFREGSHIDDASAPRQLLHCATDNLADVILKAHPKIMDENLDVVLNLMQKFAVIPVAIGVLRAELVQMRQGADEMFRTFAAKVRGKAETCKFEVKARRDCGCDGSMTVDYTDEAIRDVLLAGVADMDIRREVLGSQDIQAKEVNDVVAFVENKEMARNALPNPSTLSAVSTFKRNMSAPKPQVPAPRTQTAAQPPPPANKNQTAPCPDCNNLYCLWTENSFGWNRKPHPRCINCHRAQRRRNNGRGGARGTATSNAVEGDPFPVVSQVGSVSASKDNLKHNETRHSNNREGSCRNNKSNKNNRNTNKNDDPQIVSLEHHIFSKGAWRRAKFADHPRVNIRISLDCQRRSPFLAAPIKAVTDSGAQSDIWSLQHFLDAGFSQKDLIQVRSNLNAANKTGIKVVGAFFATLEGLGKNGERLETKSMIYVSPDIGDFYMCQETMMNLGILARDFPQIGGARASKPTNDVPEAPSINVIRAMNAGCSALDQEGPCSCPQRTTIPPLPAKLPFPCKHENNGKMREWLLEQFAASTFNTCPHRPLPVMTGPPVEIHLDPKATPKACHTAASVPLHWQKKVYEYLLRDEALGVIERVPYGEPVEWCHRMVVTRKHDGTPRRTVDLSPLNKHCKRETFSTDSPFHVARRIPGKTWKTTTDAWNGYHSCALRASDRHLTTFITPFGRWRYLRAPQGFLSSGDGYNRRFDAILSNFERKERVIDDTVHYDDDLETHWWRTIEFLRTVGAGGIVLNPEKFQFAEREVSFAGFRISEDAIEPLPKYLDAIREFPTPTSTTDIRSWFGLINQVANYAQLRDVMAPFKPFLSPKQKFTWTPELEAAFAASKESIVNAIRHGVEIFDITKPTCLRPDWSIKGLGYFLLQQHCHCPSGLPDCCNNGWRICLAGSRFLASSEQRYAPIEGEALAVAWGLEQTKYFTQGCDKLLVVTDHKPLVKILGDRTLDEINNTRLFRLKQRTLPWFFRIAHLPGKTNFAADATSRHPCPSAEVTSISASDLVEPIIAAAIRREAEGFSSITWQGIAKATRDDNSLNSLLHAIDSGSFDENLRHDPTIAPLWQHRESFYNVDGVIIYEDRVVIPPSLRPVILEHLHAAHQGVSAMENRARKIVFWPGMSLDINNVRARCPDCCKNAPSQAALPSSPATPPSTPFEAVFADYFDFAGHHYLVIGDRLSGWVEIFSTASGSSRSGALGLVACLRTFFSTFGVPEQISSDGGPEFVASATKEFLACWGVTQRISSAYNPQSNGRAEVAVKTAKRLLRSNVGPTGALDNDRLLRALLQLRNTPDPDCSLSPAQIVFGRQLRDTLAFSNKLEKFSNPSVRPEWRKAWEAKEEALKARFVRSSEALSRHARPLIPLKLGQKCFVQNQMGNAPKRWDRTGTVVDVLGHDQYRIKIDGSGRLTLRNRRFLRSFVPASSIIQTPTTHLSSPISEPSVSEPGQQVEATAPANWRASSPPPMMTNWPPQETPPISLPTSEIKVEPLESPAPIAVSDDPDAVLAQERPTTFNDAQHPAPQLLPASPTPLRLGPQPAFEPDAMAKRTRRPKSNYIPEEGVWRSTT